MKKPHFFTAVLLMLFLSAKLLAQNKLDAFWSPVAEPTINVSVKRQIIPQKYLTVQLNVEGLKSKLFSAPHEKTTKINVSNCILSLPLPNGSIQQFRVIESPIMADALAAAYPNIKTFSVKGIDDIYANGKLDWNEFGFHGMIRTVNGDFFIDPYSVGDLKNYITYYSKDFEKAHPIPDFDTDVITDTGNKSRTVSENQDSEGSARELDSTPATCVGGQLRTYRLALTCTGEYAVAATGLSFPSIPQTLSKIVTSINRVDGVYETEISVRLVLVSTQTTVIFTNAATDPYTANNNGPVLLGQSHTVLTNTIGTANFDIGHIFSTGGGGIAFLGCVCSASNKGRGVTGSANPVGDPFDIDYVAHEMGHQFEGNHTFNAVTGSCNGNRSGITSGEPGSGVTVMAYAGLCGTNNLALNSIPYFHPFSYDEIVNFTNNGNGSGCPVTLATGNQAPIVTGSGDYIVPKGTAFSLTGSAVDPDNDALTYSWEETDAGVGNGSNWNSGLRPYFRSYNPTTIASRNFPLYAIVLSGNSAYSLTRGEFVPQTAQVLKFRLTARDNKMGGGGVCYAINTITIDNSGPLTITNPNNLSVVWNSGSQQTVTWDVNSTNLAPVSCSNVRIWLSTDGGVTYNVLVNSTANDGVEIVTSPTVAVINNTCRIKVESLGNVFYDVSDNNFTISTSTVSLPTGISQVSQNNPLALKVWPNPFSSLVNVAIGNLKSDHTTELKIVDVLGKTVYQKNYSNKSELIESIDLSATSNGIYFIHVINNNNRSFYRIIK